MALDELKAPSPAVELHPQRDATSPTREFHQLYQGMRSAIQRVYPDRSDTWNWHSEIDGPQRTNPPPATAAVWLEHWYGQSHPFCQALAQRYITLWRDLEKRKFKANGKDLYDHQKALFAWLTIGGICAGVRDQMPAVLIRSPYGSGKTLIGGLAVEGFQDLLLEQMIIERVKRDDLPRGAILGLRKEVTMQNALGEQYLALRPPYTVDVRHARAFYDQLELLFGEAFTKFFKKPHGEKDDWNSIFQYEDGEEYAEAGRRVSAYLTKRGLMSQFNKSEAGEEIFTVLRGLSCGEIVLIPDVHNVPRQRPGRHRDIDADCQGFRGDIAYALNPALGIRASHRHLMPDPSLYTRDLTPEKPALFCIATGTALTRKPDSIRGDFYEEIMPNLQFMLVDEARKYSPESLTNSAYQISKRTPLVMSLTGEDEGIAGWRPSPRISDQRAVEIGLTKPIAFQIIGDDKNRFPEGSEGAWRQYEQALFTPVQAATKLKLPQPWEVNGLVIVPPSLVREYGHRIDAAYKKRDIEAEIYCYDARVKDEDRWKLIEDTLRGEGSTGVPKKIVAAPVSLSIGLSIPIGCIDVLASMRLEDLRQLLGRLYHQRNLGGTREARTYFRQQVFTMTQDILLREIAKEMEYAFCDQGALWVPLQCGIDRTAKQADDRRRGLGKALPVPDARVQGKRVKFEIGTGPEWKQMEITSPYWSGVMQQRAERQAASRLGRSADDGPSRNGPLCSAEKSYTNRKLKVALALEATGMVSRQGLFDLARVHGLGSYQGILEADAEMAFKQGKRGTDLALAVADTVNRLLDRWGRVTRNGDDD